MTLVFGERSPRGTSAGEAESQSHRAGIKKQLIDRLVALGAFPASPDRDTHVNEIVQELRSNVEAQSVGFGDLDQLATLARQNPDHLKDIAPTITNTAEILLAEIMAHKLEAKRLDIGLPTVWAALNAWDELRVASTENLASELLDNFWGSGRDQLKRAQEVAKEKKIPFTTALDQVNKFYAA